MDVMHYALKEIDAHVATHNALRRKDVLTALGLALTEIEKTVRSGHTILICGNGGSATDALHIAAELVGRFRVEGPAFGVLALVENIAAVTAIANDYSYDEVFARQLEAFGRPGDVLLALSTSGNSANCIRACQKAQSLGITSIALTGESGGALAQVADLVVRVPSSDTAHIQEAHETLGHIIAGVAERAVRGEQTESHLFG